MISSCTSLSHMERIVKMPTRSPMCKFSAADGGGTSDRFSTFFKWKKPTAKFRIDIRNSIHFGVLLAKSRYQYNADLLSLPMPPSNSSQKSALHVSTCKSLSRGTSVVVTISVTLSKTVFKFSKSCRGIFYSTEDFFSILSKKIKSCRDLGKLTISAVSTTV